MDTKFLESMDAHPSSVAIEQLRQALEQNEFELYFQPILAFAGSERYPMAEVLVRMREEERSLLPPGEFLPVLEHYGMMPELDRWVVTRVIECLANGSPLPRFTINVSAQTLEDPQFVVHVAVQGEKRAWRRRRCCSRSTKPTCSPGRRRRCTSPTP